ncbi:MAG: ABC transporter ATP-binding protein [Andreesenia angusta]|nr:ABC transporter ATP-binding protein [Andreesenia angusta]
MKKEILKVENLSISFVQYGKKLEENTVNPVKSLNIEIEKGKILAIVGASGSGKSLLAHAIMGILPRNATVTGNIFYKGEKLDRKRVKDLRGREIAFIPQSVNYLDPSMKVKKQVQIGLSENYKVKYQEELFEKYGLKKSDGELYPHQLSGGMLRRVLFATSIREGVELIIADEPTPGVHPEALESMLNELRELADSGVAVMLITHDIFSAIRIADYVTIFKDGEIVETSPSESFKNDGEELKTEYAKELWKALPQNRFIELEDFSWL